MLRAGWFLQVVSFCKFSIDLLPLCANCAKTNTCEARLTVGSSAHVPGSLSQGEGRPWLYHHRGQCTLHVPLWARSVTLSHTRAWHNVSSVNLNHKQPRTTKSCRSGQKGRVPHAPPHQKHHPCLPAHVPVCLCFRPLPLPPTPALPRTTLPCPAWRPPV